MPSQTCGVTAKISEVQTQSRVPWWHCKWRLWGLHSFYWARLVYGRKSNGYCKTTRLSRTSSWCSICPHAGKIAQNSKDTNGQNHGENWRSRGTSWTKLKWSSISRIAMGERIRGSFIWTWMGNSTKLGMYFLTSKTRVISDIFCGWHQNGWNAKQNMVPLWKKFMKDVDLEDPPSYLDHENLGCTQREFKPDETIVIIRKTKMFESHISAGTTAKLPVWGETSRKIVAALSDIVNWQTRKWSNCTKFQALVWMIINLSRKNSNQLENFLKSARNLSWNARTWHELVDQTFCGRLTNLQDQSLNGLRHVTDDKHHVGNTSQHCRWGLFQDSDFAGDLEHSKSNSGGVLCFFGSRTFVPVSWMCKKQSSVSHSSTESEIISLDAGLRMDGVLALDLWDIVIEVLRSTNNTVKPNHDSTRENCARQNTKRKTQKKAQGWSIVWCGSRTH